MEWLGLSVICPTNIQWRSDFRSMDSWKTQYSEWYSVMLVIQNSSNGVGGVLGLGVTTGDVFDDEHGRLSVPLLWSHLLPIENHITYAELKCWLPILIL